MNQFLENSALLAPWIKRPIDLHLDCLIEHGNCKKYKSGAVIFYEGDIISSLFYLLVGKVKLTLLYPHGSELLLAVHEAKNIFGQTALGNTPTFYTATAMTDLEVVILSVNKVSELAHQDTKIFLGLLRTISIENRQLAGQLSCAVLTDASARVGRLLYFAFKNNLNCQERLFCTHQEIANIVGLSRSTVTTVLNCMEKQGILKKGRSSIEIKDHQRLRELLDSKKSVRSRIIDSSSIRETHD